jgi:hypothetical protein
MLLEKTEVEIKKSVLWFESAATTLLVLGAFAVWTLFTPEATLFSDDDKQVTTHFFGPNSSEHGTIRAAWQSGPR